MMLGYQASDSETTCEFFKVFLFFNPTDRSNIRERIRPKRKKKKKRGWGGGGRPCIGSIGMIPLTEHCNEKRE